MVLWSLARLMALDAQQMLRTQGSIRRNKDPHAWIFPLHRKAGNSQATSSKNTAEALDRERVSATLDLFVCLAAQRINVSR
jgi:hypothetical protein